jgi:cation diffusion facilitator CzcD-associated flavoprotein CzcO
MAEPVGPVRCDVVIVGAGSAGLNALYVAARHLSRDQKVVLIDQRPRGGGMWVDTYPYVRLHQPYRLFTAGNIKWTLNRGRSYLATRNEVLDHFEHCLEVIRRQVRLDEYYGCTFTHEEETGGVVRVHCRNSDGTPLVVEAKRLIKAYGYRVVPNDALESSSARVHSVSPDHCDLQESEMQASDAPIWIVGGGKTGMDTAKALLAAYPGREVNLVAGTGRWFLSRERCYPTGASRWWRGKPTTAITGAAALRFDGTNEAEVDEWMRTRYGTWPAPRAGHFMFAIQSESETTRISQGLNQVVMDHLEDAVDRDGASELVLRSGATIRIPSDSWIVNCTGYVFHEGHPYEPYLSPGGGVLSIQPRSATFHIPSFMAYFMTHLLFLDRLRDAELYELDIVELRKKSTAALSLAMMSLAHHNVSVVADSVPMKAFLDFGVDLDRWYPLPRRGAHATRFMLQHRRDRPHHRRTLDVIRDRFDVRCGPLEA